MNRIAMLTAVVGLCFAGGVRAAEGPPEAAAPPPTATGKVECVPTGRCDAVRVHFAFDSAKLDEEAMKVLDYNAECLKNNPGVQITIAGNTDKRGSEEYNIELGKQRAEAVSCYLQSKGVPTGQLSTVSFGKERPICQAKTEPCFAENRNATLTPEAPVAMAE